MCPLLVRNNIVGEPPSTLSLRPYILQRSLNPLLLSADEVDNRISARSLGHLKFYDGLNHTGMFSLAKHLRQEPAKPGQLITDNNPIYIYSD